MAEAILLLKLPAVLQLASGALSYAWVEYNRIKERKAQCKLLLDQCQELVSGIAKQCQLNTLPDSLKGELYFLERLTALLLSCRGRPVDVDCRACQAVKLAMVNLSGKSFAWRLLHQDDIAMHISQAEQAVTFACTRFNVGRLLGSCTNPFFILVLQIGAHLSSHKLQADLAAARERDHHDLVVHLESLSGSDQKILDALQNDGKERRQLQELLIALTKVSRSFPTNELVFSTFDALSIFRVLKPPPLSPTSQQPGSPAPPQWHCRGCPNGRSRSTSPAGR